MKIGTTPHDGWAARLSSIDVQERWDSGCIFIGSLLDIGCDKVVWCWGLGRESSGPRNPGSLLLSKYLTPKTLSFLAPK